MAKTYWALKHVSSVFDYKVLTMHAEVEQRIVKRHKHLNENAKPGFLNCQRKIRFFDAITMKI